MNQRELMDLLLEAADPDVPLCLVVSISKTLFDQCVRIRGKEDEVTKLLADLFDQVVCNRSDVLPQLFPFFAAICVAPIGDTFADVDWDIVP